MILLASDLLIRKKLAYSLSVRSSLSSEQLFVANLYSSPHHFRCGGGRDRFSRRRMPPGQRPLDRSARRSSDDDLLLCCTMFTLRMLRAQHNSLAFTLECVSVARNQD